MPPPRTGRVRTKDGITRFDGVRSQVWRHWAGAADGFPSSIINAVHVDAAGVVWLGTPRGQAQLDRTASRFLQVAERGRLRLGPRYHRRRALDLRTGGCRLDAVRSCIRPEGVPPRASPLAVWPAGETTHALFATSAGEPTGVWEIALRTRRLGTVEAPFANGFSVATAATVAASSQDSLWLYRPG